MTGSELDQLTGKLLRTGRVGEYQFLGSGGRQVFKSASQLKDIVRRKLKMIDGLPNVAYTEHFAVPVIDPAGDVINWYSNYPGDVIPWGSATEPERAVAEQQLRTLERKIFEQCKSEQPQDAGTSAADFVPETLINKLLMQMLHTPDSDHIYLVNGLPVLTFWGFIYPKAHVPTDPLHHLIRQAVEPPLVTPPPVVPPVTPVPPTVAPVTPASAPVAPPVTPTPVLTPQPAVVEVVKKPWWRRWLWWLLLLLLLLLLLFGLRQCRPDMANNLAMPGFSMNKPEFSWPELPSMPSMPSLPKMPQMPSMPSLSDLGFNKPKTPDMNGDDGDGMGMPDMTPPGGGLPDLPNLPDGAGSADVPALDGGLPGADPMQSPGFAPPQIPGNQAGLGANTARKPLGRSLQIPTNVPNGQAHFLNGKWKAGAGIQDKNTGKPLRLEYEFNEGKGQVTVKAADGMRCTGNVDAHMQGGFMRIESLEPAVCADGSSFDMPQITCRAGAKSAADCIGNYADTRFPISMRNAQ